MPVRECDEGHFDARKHEWAGKRGGEKGGQDRGWHTCHSNMICAVKNRAKTGIRKKAEFQGEPDAKEALMPHASPC